MKICLPHFRALAWTPSCSKAPASRKFCQLDPGNSFKVMLIDIALPLRSSVHYFCIDETNSIYLNFQNNRITYDPAHPNQLISSAGTFLWSSQRRHQTRPVACRPWRVSPMGACHGGANTGCSVMPPPEASYFRHGPTGGGGVSASCGRWVILLVDIRNTLV